MNAMWSEARVKVSHWLAMHLHVDLFRLRNATPMVSFTFDDLPKSAVTTGAGLLEARGARGTFYVSGGLVSVGTSQWETGDSSDVLALHLLWRGPRPTGASGGSSRRRPAGGRADTDTICRRPTRSG